MKNTVFKKLLLAAVAAGSVIVPAMAEAQDYGRRGGDDSSREERRQERSERRSERQAERGQRGDRPQGEHQAPQGQHQGQQGPRQGPQGDRSGGRPDRGQYQGRPDRGQNQNGQYQGRQNRNNYNPGRPDPRGPGGPRNPNSPNHRPGQTSNYDWNGGGRNNGSRGERHNRWRNQIHNNWNRDSWRRNWNSRHGHNWWRNHSWWRGWRGVRIGFYFAPGYGYYNVPRSYWGHNYYEGSYLPSFFFRYRVSDPYFYNLPPAPPGTAWVYVDNNILLVDLSDGYVIEVINRAWDW